MTKRDELMQLTADVFSKGLLKKIVFSRPVGDAPSKIAGRSCIHRQQKLLVLESFLSGNTVSQKNLSEPEILSSLTKIAADFRQINLLTEVGDAEYKTSGDGKEVLLGAEKLRRKMNGVSADFQPDLLPMDHEKQYILTGSEPFLHALGISDAAGRVHDKMQGKFRQINRFLEHISDLFDKMPTEGTLRIYDLCCGKSYLSFAVYHYMTAIRRRSVSMLCVDLKEDVIRYCETVANSLGFDGMVFLCQDITTLPKDERVDMVISLHACDLATDVVLNTAIDLRARVILSTPCCHRYLNEKIQCPELSFVTDFPHLKGKLCEAVTDAIRLARLQCAGYSVTAPELTDPTDTPKNTLIRAVKIKSDGSEAAKIKYREILRFVLGDNAETYLDEIK